MQDVLAPMLQQRPAVTKGMEKSRKPEAEGTVAVVVKPARLSLCRVALDTPRDRR